MYNDSHPDLAEEMDISYDAVFVKMGEYTAEKAKDKFAKMKNQAAIAVT